MQIQLGLLFLKAEWVPFVRWQRNGRNISYEANHFQQMRVIWVFVFYLQSKVASKTAIPQSGKKWFDWLVAALSELLIASHCYLSCSFIFKTSLVFQPQSRVVLNCAGPRVSTYSEVQECLQTESPRVPTQWSPRVPTYSQVQECPHTVKPTDCVQKTTECLQHPSATSYKK